MSLFPADVGGSTSAKKPLLQFRAGRMHREGTWVKPDTRKGLIYLEQSEDGLMHFHWKDRSNNAVEEDLIIFPQEAEFKRVPECTTGRVYMLHFSSSSRKLFFWLQEPKEDKDEETCTKLNNLINNPPTPGSAGGHPPANLLAQMFGGMAGNAGLRGSRRAAQPVAAAASQAPVAASSSATPAALPTSAEASSTPATPVSAITTGQPPTPAAPTRPSAPAASQSSSTILPYDLLQSMLANIQVPQRPAIEDADLSRILTPENVAPLLQDPAVQQRLFPFLPDRAERTHEELQEIIRSAQFRQAVSSLNHALQSGQLAPLISQLGLDPVVGGPLGGVEAFIAAIRQQAERRRNNQSAPEDDRMDTS